MNGVSIFFPFQYFYSFGIELLYREERMIERGRYIEGKKEREKRKRRRRIENF